MRIKGNVSPDKITIESYPSIAGYVEVKIRDNINKLIDNYEYDEYTFLLKSREGLKQEIETNFDEWIITGRTLEVNDGASLVKDMREALSILGVSE